MEEVPKFYLSIQKANAFSDRHGYNLYKRSLPDKDGFTSVDRYLASFHFEEGRELAFHLLDRLNKGEILVYDLE